MSFPYSVEGVQDGYSVDTKQSGSDPSHIVPQHSRTRSEYQYHQATSITSSSASQHNTLWLQPPSLPLNPPPHSLPTHASNTLLLPPIVSLAGPPPHTPMPYPPYPPSTTQSVSSSPDVLADYQVYPVDAVLPSIKNLLSPAPSVSQSHSEQSSMPRAPPLVYRNVRALHPEDHIDHYENGSSCRENANGMAQLPALKDPSAPSSRPSSHNDIPSRRQSRRPSPLSPSQKSYNASEYYSERYHDKGKRRVDHSGDNYPSAYLAATPKLTALQPHSGSVENEHARLLLHLSTSQPGLGQVFYPQPPLPPATSTRTGRSHEFASITPEMISSNQGNLFSGAHSFAMHQPTFVVQPSGTGSQQLEHPAAMTWLKASIIEHAQHDSAGRDPPPRCHPDTRISILERTHNWIDNPQRQKRLLWIRGPAGVGKSAIVQTIADSLSVSGRLISTLFFSRPNGRSNPQRVFPTIAYQLASQDSTYRSYIEAIRPPDSQPLEAKAMKEQFRLLIVEPLAKNILSCVNGDILIAIDGLDECDGDPDYDSSDQAQRRGRSLQQVHREIIGLISDFIRAHPSIPAVWIIASRPESHITSMFTSRDVKDGYTEESISVDDEEARRDVEKFLIAEFGRIAEAYPDHITTTPWPAYAQFLQIAQAASGLFIFGEVVIRFIDDPETQDPVSQLAHVLTAIDKLRRSKEPKNPLSTLDVIYTAILARIPPARIKDLEKILPLLVYIHGRNIKVGDYKFRNMYEHFDISREDAITSVNYLHSVIYFPRVKDIGETQPRFYHASFRDYLEDPSRSGEYTIERWNPYLVWSPADADTPVWSDLRESSDAWRMLLQTLSPTGCILPHAPPYQYNVSDEQVQVILDGIDFRRLLLEAQWLFQALLKEATKKVFPSPVPSHTAANVNRILALPSDEIGVGRWGMDNDCAIFDYEQSGCLHSASAEYAVQDFSLPGNEWQYSLSMQEHHTQSQILESDFATSFFQPWNASSLSAAELPTSTHFRQNLVDISSATTGAPAPAYQLDHIISPSFGNLSYSTTTIPPTSYDLLTAPANSMLDVIPVHRTGHQDPRPMSNNMLTSHTLMDMPSSLMSNDLLALPCNNILPSTKDPWQPVPDIQITPEQLLGTIETHLPSLHQAHASPELDNLNQMLSYVDPRSWTVRAQDTSVPSTTSNRSSSFRSEAVSSIASGSESSLAQPQSDAKGVHEYSGGPKRNQRTKKGKGGNSGLNPRLNASSRTKAGGSRSASHVPQRKAQAAAARESAKVVRQYPLSQTGSSSKTSLGAPKATPQIMDIGRGTPPENVVNSGVFAGAHDVAVNNPMFINVNPRSEGEFEQADHPKAMAWLRASMIEHAQHDSAGRDPPPRCHPDTRISILGRTHNWVNNPQRQKRLLWIRGPAGVGKSAIVQTVVDSLSIPESKRLIASLFFSRPNGRSNPQRVFPTIAYQLASQDSAYRAYIETIRPPDSPPLEAKAMKEQFRLLVVEPLVKSRISTTNGDILIAIDGLDECDAHPDYDSSDPAQRRGRSLEQVHSAIIELISDFILAYPSIPVVWIIASRPESHITSTFTSRNVKNSYTEESISVDDEEACRDVEKFLTAEFEKLAEAYPDHITITPWPTNPQFLRIAQAASGLFIFGEVVIRFIGDPEVRNPISQLEHVLTAIDKLRRCKKPKNPLSALDVIYTAILARIPLARMEDLKKILPLVFYVNRKSISVHNYKFRNMYEHLDISRGDAITSFNYLHSVIYFARLKDVGETQPRFYHASFRDYLEDPSRSGEYTIAKWNPNLTWPPATGKPFPVLADFSEENVPDAEIPDWSDSGRSWEAWKMLLQTLSPTGCILPHAPPYQYIVSDEQVQVILDGIDFRRSLLKRQWLLQGVHEEAAKKVFPSPVP
ncbi:hypothetical protein NP233_g4147 [Leucocoprinus birnbaumii]|uniref:NACHT domain-containing protein n=1 Tax=Leucocoprinus birnbaumii TaxID=56174 RepID=A0AAD5VVY6_9AGAR|nr:hypothetical protein NP233_g4147 [Leucocoprinus birnbaumii]